MQLINCTFTGRPVEPCSFKSSKEPGNISRIWNPKIKKKTQIWQLVELRFSKRFPPSPVCPAVFALSWYGAGEALIDLDSSIARLAGGAAAFKLPIISFLCVNMCFLSGAWRPEEEKKTRMKTALTSNYTQACPGDGPGWALVCWRSKRLYAPEREETMAIGRHTVRQLQALCLVLFKLWCWWLKVTSTIRKMFPCQKTECGKALPYIFLTVEVWQQFCLLKRISLFWEVWSTVRSYCAFLSSLVHSELLISIFNKG